LEDETEIVQSGLSHDTEFYEYGSGTPHPSSWNKYPTEENPSRRYKFISLDLVVGSDKLIINRETYALLDWLGDLGGLFDALFLLCGAFAGPVANFRMRATLFSKFFRFKPRECNFDVSQGTSDAAKRFFELFYHNSDT
jgi:hypothetical protein